MVSLFQGFSQRFPFIPFKTSRFETSPYKKFRKSQSFMEDVAIDLISRKLEIYHDELKGTTRNFSLLDGYLRNPKLNFPDIIGMACDLLLAGVDTSSYTTSYALFHLGMNPAKQQLLYEESRRVLPEKDSKGIDLNTLTSGVTYARAVLRESLRLNPIAIGVGRVLNNDTVLSGYLIPKGTIIVTQTQVASLLERHFENPNEFKPERWLRTTEGPKTDINPYTSLPFGHGSRSCIARRFAEQNILIFLLRLVRKFEIKWTGNPVMEYSTKLINVPDQPISVELVERCDWHTWQKINIYPDFCIIYCFHILWRFLFAYVVDVDRVLEKRGRRFTSWQPSLLSWRPSFSWPCRGSSWAEVSFL